MAMVINEIEAFARNVLTQLDLINNFETEIGGNSIGMGEDGQFLVKLHPARWSRCARPKSASVRQQTLVTHIRQIMVHFGALGSIIAGEGHKSAA